ncbi:MAG: ABC transporter permease [Anaerolineae bacterium]|nr:ABC transporter permease [Anaerolineae bacterium]
MMITGLFDNIRIAVTQLLSNKLRTILTMLGVIIGIASVVLLLSLGQAVQSSITAQFEGLGASLIRISSTSSDAPLTTDLADALRARLTTAAYVMPQTSGNYAVVYNGDEFSVGVTGATTDYLNINERSLTSGRFFTEDELNSSARLAVIGVETAENLFDTANPLGNEIRIGTVFFQVIGVLNDTGGEDDDLIIVPITAAQTRLNATRTNSGEPVVNMILVLAADNEQVDAATEEVETIMRQERNLSATDSDNFRAFTASTILDSLTSSIETITVFLGMLAGISLVVGGIGVMNIMLVTVNERTREIGLRKAVGAQRWDIVFQFLTEAIVITMLGGLIGVLIAVAGATLITTLVSDFNVIIQPSSLLLAAGIAAGVGVFFGVYPASRAASLSPIDALRYE